MQDTMKNTVYANTIICKLEAGRVSNKPIIVVYHEYVKMTCLDPSHDNHVNHILVNQIS